MLVLDYSDGKRTNIDDGIIHTITPSRCADIETATDNGIQETACRDAGTNTSPEVCRARALEEARGYLQLGQNIIFEAMGGDSKAVRILSVLYGPNAVLKCNGRRFRLETIAEKIGDYWQGALGIAESQEAQDRGTPQGLNCVGGIVSQQ